MEDVISNVGLSPGRSSPLDVNVKFQNATRERSATYEVTTLEPSLQVGITSNVSFLQPDGRDPVLFTITVTHEPQSTAAAYQVGGTSHMD